MGETLETVTDFIFLDSKITVDGDCSHEIKRQLLFGRKAMMNLDSILKSRDITLLTKVHLVKAMVFPVVMYGCESWTVRKAEHWRNWCVWTVVLEKTLESPLDCKQIKQINPKGNQPWIFIGRTDAEVEALVFCPSDAKNQLIGKDRDAGKDWGQEEKGVTEDGIINTMDKNLSKLWEVVKDREAWHAAVHGVAKSWTWVSHSMTIMLPKELSERARRPLTACLSLDGIWPSHHLLS